MTATALRGVPAYAHTGRITLSTIVTDTEFCRITHTDGETLDQTFRRVHETIGTITTGAGQFDSYRLAAKQALYRDESLTIGQVYALWVEVALAETEDDHYDTLSAALNNDAMPLDEKVAVFNKNDQRRTRRRTAVTKRAYGIPYTQFEKEVTS